ncbi:uncharacterized protein VICG_01957 [Vittaforma corneae ATCC 50505]|uniref:AAA+ ATPase domain-containing protein n=1 Tax=Vittaforma corneae (strain ATCC 50505) TaxID=993615 RepID=L2GJE3_VITCO|nr:uncharacterized protein VICG_01957 [Vittaforma corneae ATCC 50505]ELA40998.1 hypothetical protein VICG_01957 [Vittaforma corneae ATCC 50505]
MGSLPWFIKYRPSKFTELYFPDDSGFKLLQWLRNAQQGSILNLFGAVGTGKTSLVYAVAKALKYRVIEYDTIQDKDPKDVGKSKSIEGLKPLILVNESDVPISVVHQKFHNLNAPVIFTTSNTLARDVESLKIHSPSSEIILNSVRSILKSENRWLDDRFILRLCEACSYDFRSVINYCQVFSRSSEIKDLAMVEKIASQNITSACRLILSKRMSLRELETLYSEKLLDLCLSSVLENSKDVGLLKAIESVSELASFPERLKFLSIDGLNKLRSDFIYKKEDALPAENFHGHEDPLQYLPLYHRNLQNKQSVLHLQAIFNKYQIKDLPAVDQEIKDHIGLTSIDTRVLKYKHSLGSSSAVKRDISLKELLDL